MQEHYKNNGELRQAHFCNTETPEPTRSGNPAAAGSFAAFPRAGGAETTDL